MAQTVNASSNPTPVAPVALTTTAQTIYTAPAYPGNGNVTSPNATASLVEFIVTNTTSGTLNAYVFLVPSSGSATTTNAIWYGTPINGNDAKGWGSLKCFMAPGDTLQAYGSAAGLSIRASATTFQ